MQITYFPMQSSMLPAFARVPLQQAEIRRLSVSDIIRAAESIVVSSNDGAQPLDSATILRQFLGQKGYSRLLTLKESKQGWNHGKGEPLHEGSLKACLNLANKLTSLASRVKLRIYLSENGGLNLVWDNAMGETKMIRCMPNQYLVFNEELGLEKHFALTDAYAVLLATGLAPLSLA